MAAPFPPAPLAPDFALWPAERFLRRWYVWVVVVMLVVLVGAYEVIPIGFDLVHWDWLFVSGMVVLLVALRMALDLPGPGAADPQPAGQPRDSGRRPGRPGRLRRFHGHAAQIRPAGKCGAGRRHRIALCVLGSWLFAYGAMIVTRPAVIVAEVAGAALAGLFIGRAVGYGRLGRRLEHSALTVKPEPDNFDGAAGLRPIGNLYFFQAGILALPASFLAIWWLIIPALGKYAVWRGPYAAFLALVLLLEVLAFVVPLLAFHRLMVREKAELMVQADRHSQEAASVRRQLLSAAPDQRLTLEMRLAWLGERYSVIETMTTWPVSAPIRRRFTINNALLLLPIAMQAFGVSPKWQELLENLHKAMS
ncbi:hypothetical protein [Fodinicola feengrottensis]|uniref:hypothetical protein n=1 Tax=Fodinicola feengrottensis TaxID=435914 RepID=UPI0013D292D4|nr:hypothetical protein [Fodinicola feengrottensis]